MLPDGYIVADFIDRIKSKGKKVLVFSTRGHISLELINPSPPIKRSGRTERP